MKPSHQQALALIGRYERKNKRLRSYWELRNCVKRLEQQKERVKARFTCYKRADVKLPLRIAVYRIASLL